MTNGFVKMQKNSAERAVNLGRKGYNNYSFDRIEKRVFRGYSGKVEIFTKNGVFALKKDGIPDNITISQLMDWTNIFKTKNK
jgi:ribosomal protein S1